MKTGVEISHMYAETAGFMKRADTLIELVQSDIGPVARQVRPLLQAFKAIESLSAEERLAIVGAIRALAEASGRARSDAIRQLAKRV